MRTHLVLSGLAVGAAVVVSGAPHDDAGGLGGGLLASIQSAGPQHVGPHQDARPLLRLDLETVPVGNAGNPDDTHGWGGVSYAFDIGKYEITAGQYTAFLNAVAASDTHQLYRTSMWTNPHGCGIQRHGRPGSYSYSVAPELAERPVNFVSWGDAARFANWLHNGQPAGAQDLTTTEDGAYLLDGAQGDDELLDVVREPGARWAIPTEDEWYKAAHHANDGVTGNYFNFPMSADGVPSNDLVDPDPGNHATFHDFGYTIGAPYRTPVGAHENSASPYGAFDMGGNVWEWNEALIGTTSRGVRGASYATGLGALFAGYQAFEFYPTDEYHDIGIRVCAFP
jgi:formylglycine-generating enzyme required for sulfatase activity